MKWDYQDQTTDFNSSGKGLFIVCEGNFQYGNSTLSFYEPSLNIIENEVFYRANGMKLGDVAQSMTIYDEKGWIVVNNSHVIFAIDTDTFREIGRIENLTSPRYIHFINDEKAYVSQIWDNRIFIVNPKNYSITGSISVPDMDMSSASTEQMVSYGKYVYCNCWSYQNRIIKIDSEKDEVVESLVVGLQPNSLVIDRNHNLWTITDGGFDGSPYGNEPPSLICIDVKSFSIIKRFEFNLGDNLSKICINTARDKIYWINNDVWAMDIESETLPEIPIIPYRETRFYGLSVSPDDSEIYVADAIDFSQQGMICRFSQDGILLDEFYVGVTPAAFCWK